MRWGPRVNTPRAPEIWEEKPRWRPRGPWKTRCRKHTGFQNVTQHLRPPFPSVLFNFTLLFPPSPVQPEFKIPAEASDAYPLSLQGYYRVLNIWA